MEGAKPSTLRDYRSMLAEPGRPYRRGRGQDDRPHRVRARRSRGGRSDHGARGGSASRTRARGRRRSELEQAPPGPLGDLQLRAAPRTSHALGSDWQSCCRGGEAPRGRSAPALGGHRRADRGLGTDCSGRPGAARTSTSTPDGELVRAEEDAQLAGFCARRVHRPRVGGLVALRWRDVHWSERVLVVERRSPASDAPTASPRLGSGHAGVMWSDGSAVCGKAGTSSVLGRWRAARSAARSETRTAIARAGTTPSPALAPVSIAGELVTSSAGPGAEPTTIRRDPLRCRSTSTAS
jgi:hypothetical protein